MTNAEKTHFIEQVLYQLAAECRDTGRENGADRMHRVRLELTASPDVAARFYDLMRGEG